MTMLRTRIRDVDEDSIAGLLTAVGFKCGVDFMDQPGMTLFDFIELCFTRYGLKKSVKTLPIDGILNTKLSKLNGTPLARFLREYCAFRYIVYEAYENRQTYCVLAACAPNFKKSTGRNSIASHSERLTGVIKQRRANGDL